MPLYVDVYLSMKWGNNSIPHFSNFFANRSPSGPSAPNLGRSHAMLTES